MTRSFLLGTIVAVLGLYSATAAAYKPGTIVTNLSTAVVPLTGLAVGYFTDDTEGEKQWLRNTGLRLVLT